ncbi:MAG: sugar ABC transporter substrate-binding protein [Oscillospiraceae bacterium]|nr:sugar ABC transporter substrate-binding protein [Oscillospiraceae bacterium]
MKKTAMRFLSLALLAAICLTGCGKTASSVSQQATSQPTTATEKTKIVFWTNQRHDMEYLEAKIKEFNDTNDKNIEVTCEIMTDNYDNNLELSYQSNQAPDVFRAKSEIVPYIKKDMIIPIDEFLTEEDKARFGDTLGIQNINMYEDKLYSLPAFGNNFRLIYNKDVFAAAGLDPEAPPTTMEEVREYAKIITEKLSNQGVYGFAMNLKGAYSSMYRSVDEVARLSDMFYYDYKEGKYNFNEYAKVVQNFADIYADGSFFPGAESLDIDPLRTQFALGKIGMYMSGYWEVAVYNSQFPTEQEWAACQLPTYDGVVDGVNTMNSAGRSYVISNQCKNPEAAWELIKFLTSDDYMVGYQAGGYGNIVVPSVAKIAKPSEIYGSSFFTLSDTDSIEPLAPEMAGLTIEGKTFYEEYAAVIFGEADLNDVTERVTKTYNDALEAAISSGSMQPILK